MNSYTVYLGTTVFVAIVGCSSVPNVTTIGSTSTSVNQTSVLASQTNVSQVQNNAAGMTTSPAKAGMAPLAPLPPSQSVPVRSITVELEQQDMRAVVDVMVNSLLADESVITSCTGVRPVLDFGRIESRLVGQRVDTKTLKETLRTNLLRSRKFRFVDRTSAAEDLRFMNDQALNGMTDASQVVPTGQQTAAKLYLYGSISELRHVVASTIDQSYLFTLNLKDLRTGEVIWSDEKPIRKVQQ